MTVRKIRPRGNTAAFYTAVDPVLQARELVIETDTGRAKHGDGTTAWNGLPYITASPADLGISFEVGTPATTWGPFTHGLPYDPNVTCIDSAGSVFIPDTVSYGLGTVTATVISDVGGTLIAS